jgi:hypothetical protein
MTQRVAWNITGRQSCFCLSLLPIILAYFFASPSGGRKGSVKAEGFACWAVVGSRLWGINPQVNHIRPGRCEGGPGGTEPLRSGLSEQTQMKNDATKNLHHMHQVVDEMTDFQLSTNRGIVLPLQAETHMVWLQAGAREIIDGLQPGQGSLLHAWPRLQDDPHPTVTG